MNARLPSGLALLISTLLLLSACTSPPPPPPPQPDPITPEPVVTLTAPPPEDPQVEALRALASMQERIDQVAAPLLLHNHELCKNQARNLLGFNAKTQYSYSSEFVQTAQVLFNLGERLQITGVLNGSGAARAGLRKGDILIAAEGKTLPIGQNAERAAGAILAPLASSRANMKLTIQRDGKQQEITVPLTRACAFRIDLGNADNVNSYADGQRAMITRGMLNFTQSNHELAYVIAKEMAHNILGHAAKQRSNSIVAQQIDNLISARPDLSMLIGSAGIKPTPTDMDLAADYLSVYLLARAGYAIDQVPAFWQRLASYYPASVLNAHTAIHPGHTARVTALEKSVKEVRAKQKARLALLP
jgi:Peptidase family M48